MIALEKLCMGGQDSAMTESYEDEKGWFEEVNDKHGKIVPHITKIGRSEYRGMYNYFYPPRIGIDFFPWDKKGRYFIPNLDLGDIARLVRVLELTQEEDVFRQLESGAMRPFEIGLSFEKDLERTITVGASSDYLVVTYRGFHKDTLVEFDHNLSLEGVDRLINILKNLVVEYESVISKYVMTGEVDKEFK